MLKHKSEMSKYFIYKIYSKCYQLEEVSKFLTSGLKRSTMHGTIPVPWYFL